MRVGVGVLAVLLCLLLGQATAPAWSIEVEFSSRPVRREIVALYDSKVEARPGETRIHRFAEMPLNWLGYALVYRDINEPLPELETLGRYRGVISWFLEPLTQPAVVADWLDTATRAGLRYALFGEPAPPLEVGRSGALARVMGRLGLADGGNHVEVTFDSRIVSSDPEMIGFERAIDAALPTFSVVRAVSDKVAVHLAIATPARRAQEPASRSVIVATGPGGGFVQADYAIYYEAATEREVWIVHPFNFFRRVFGDEAFPIPDITTVSGRRVYFSHIDGDGWNNLTEIEAYRAKGLTAAEVILKTAIGPYPDLPVTVGLIGGDADRLIGGRKRAQDLARALYALDQVEVATHTYTHPYNWRFFERYDRTLEEQAISQYQLPDLPMRERITNVLLRLVGATPPAPTFDKYIAGTDDLPRTFLRKPFDLDREVGGALALAESFAPPGKKAKVYLWSGDTTPFAGAIGATRKAGVRNLNGGDSRLDDEYPSVSYVPPISRVERGERQIYAANSNENTYTNDWTGPYYGFFLLEETLRNTERPRRLKPFNLYYHMYSGEKAAALASIQHFLDMARDTEVVPIEASRYAAMADDFFGVTIAQTDVATWYLSNLGAVETVRFDVAAGLDVDHVSSRGVLGSTRHAGALYVALDPAQASVIVTLKPEAALAADRLVGRPLLSLVSGRWRLSDRREDGCGLAMTAQGYGQGDFVFRTRAKAAFSVTTERSGRILSEEVVWADGEGRLRLALDVDARAPVKLRFACHE